MKGSNKNSCWTHFTFIMLSLVVLTRRECLAGIVNQQYESTNAELEFGDVSTFAVDAGEHIRCMEVDLASPGNILLSTDATIQTMSTSTSTILVGALGSNGYVNGEGTNVRMNYPYVTQLDASTVLFGDNFNHCVRKFNRETNTVEDFVGLCETSGTTDGTGAAARFTYPAFLIQDIDDSDLYYLSDNPSSSAVVRLLNIDTKVVTTYYTISSSNSGIYSMLRDPFYPNLMLIGSQGQLFRIDLSSASLLDVFGSTSTGHSDSDVANSRFNGIMDIYPFAKDLYMISDAFNTLLRVIDANTDQVYSICDGNDLSVDGSLSDCSIRWVTQILYIDGSLYMAEYEKLRVLPVQVLLEATTTAVSPTTQPPITTMSSDPTPITTMSSDVTTVNTMSSDLTTVTAMSSGSTPMTTMSSGSTLITTMSSGSTPITTMSSGSTPITTMSSGSTLMTTMSSGSTSMNPMHSEPTISPSMPTSSSPVPPGTISQSDVTPATGPTYNQGNPTTNSNTRMSCATRNEDTTATRECYGGCFGLLNNGQYSLGCIEDLSLASHGFDEVVNCDAKYEAGFCIDVDDVNGDEVENCIRCCTDETSCNEDFKERCDYVPNEKECSGCGCNIGFVFFLVVCYASLRL